MRLNFHDSYKEMILSLCETSGKSPSECVKDLIYTAYQQSTERPQEAQGLHNAEKERL